jgi:hypothetical protein
MKMEMITRIMKLSTTPRYNSHSGQTGKENDKKNDEIHWKNMAI